LTRSQGCARLPSESEGRRMATIRGIATAMNALKPEMKKAYKKRVTSLFDQMVNDLGKNLRGVYNSYRWARTFTGTVRPSVRSYNPTMMLNDPDAYHYIDKALLSKNADRYASSVVDGWKAKVESKLVELDKAEVKYFKGGTFLITGTRKGDRISIEQQIITNVSSKGTLFNQFPARIYVNGKFVSEKKYKEIYR